MTFGTEMEGKGKESKSRGEERVRRKEERGRERESRGRDREMVREGERGVMGKRGGKIVDRGERGGR